MAEMEHNNYDWRNINGKATAGLTTGIIGIAGWLLNGGLGNLFGGMGGGTCACSDNIPVNRYEMSMQKELSNKDMEIAYLKGREETRKDLQDFFAYTDRRFSNVEAQIAGQAVWNATQTANIACLQGQVAEAMALSKRIIPASSVCPAPMPQYNSWTAPTAPTAG